jgi:hypothetical protein
MATEMFEMIFAAIKKNSDDGDEEALSMLTLQVILEAPAGYPHVSAIKKSRNPLV